MDTAIDARCIFQSMVRRRAAFNPLDPTPAPRWYVVRAAWTIIESDVLREPSHPRIHHRHARLDGRRLTISEFSSTSCAFSARARPNDAW